MGKKYSRHRYPVVLLLKSERERQHTPRKVLAHKTGYGLGTLGRWERGETMPSMSALHDWCAALGVRLALETIDRHSAGAASPSGKAMES